MKSERTPRDRTKPKPVKKIEVSERHIKLRGVLVVLFILIALAMFAWALISALSTDKGWYEVEVSSSELNCSSEFIFYYYIEEGGLSATEELDEVESAYGTACVNAYKLFVGYTLYDDEDEEVYNLAYVNNTPNQVITVDESLYSALQLLDENEMLSMLYLGPVYTIYYSIMYSSNETIAKQYDPYYDEDTAAYIAEVMDYISNGAISLELLGGNQVRLNVTEEYAAFIAENTESDDDEEEVVLRYLDFGVMLNAFRIDYIADYLADCGYTNGIINSYDGYTRTLGDSEEFSFTIYNKTDDGIYAAGVASGEGSVSMVTFRSYALSSAEYGYKYSYSDGTTATMYIDPQTGLYKNDYSTSLDDLVVYSYSDSCAEVLLKIYNIFIGDVFSGEDLQATGLCYVYCDDEHNILYNDGSLELTAYSYTDGTEYTAVKVDN